MKPDHRLIIILISFKLFILFFVLWQCYPIMIYPIDAHGYWKVAKDLMSLSIKQDWMYTIGHPLFYIPFIWLISASNYYDMAPVINVFSCTFLMTGSLFCSYQIMKRLSRREVAVFFALMLTVILPLIVFPVEDWNVDVFSNTFALPSFSLRNWRLFYIFHHLGYHGLSGTSSFFMVSLCFLAFVILPRRFWSIVIISALFAVACLIRINNVLFSPLVAYLIWCKMKHHEWRTITAWICRTIACVAVFLAVFSVQLLINDANYGHFMNFPYVLHNHENIYAFSWSKLLLGSRFIIQCNYVYMVPAATSFLFCKGNRINSILILWSVPYVLFFCCYPGAVNNPIRFILPCYIPLVSSFFLADIWKGMKYRDKVVLITICLLNVILLAPCCPAYGNWGLFNWAGWHQGREIAASFMSGLTFLSIVASFLYFKEQPAVMRFIIVFLVINVLANPFVIIMVFIFAFIKVLVLWTMEVVGYFRYSE